MPYFLFLAYVLHGYFSSYFISYLNWGWCYFSYFSSVQCITLIVVPSFHLHNSMYQTCDFSVNHRKFTNFILFCRNPWIIVPKKSDLVPNNLLFQYIDLNKFGLDGMKIWNLANNYRIQWKNKEILRENNGIRQENKSNWWHLIVQKSLSVRFFIIIMPANLLLDQSHVWIYLIILVLMVNQNNFFALLFYFFS